MNSSSHFPRRVLTAPRSEQRVTQNPRRSWHSTTATYSSVETASANISPSRISGCSWVVDSYLSRLGKDKYKGLFNRGGRAYPDVAAQGHRRVMVWNGKKYPVDGTSASAPTFTAVVALVNDALIADGKPPLDFLNPWSYSTGSKAFTDVTAGSNNGCNTSGFHAARGWNPASGFGTPVRLPFFWGVKLARNSKSKFS